MQRSLVWILMRCIAFHEVAVSSHGFVAFIGTLEQYGSLL